MKKLCWYLVGVFAVVGVMLLVSCAGKDTPPPVKLKSFTPESEKKSLKVATAFAEGFAAAVKSGDFKKWQQSLPPHAAAKITPELFSSICNELDETLGKLEYCVFFGTLQNGNLRDHLWKLHFVKDKKICEVLYLVRVYCAENGEPEISGFGIKRF